jgi:hypothetical protein
LKPKSKDKNFYIAVTYQELLALMKWLHHGAIELKHNIIVVNTAKNTKRKKWLSYQMKKMNLQKQ